MDSLSQVEINTLNEALDDEYRAWATYDQVITDFGEVRPFINIREAEARHIDALCVLFTHYGLPIPQNPWPGKVARFANILEACKAGVTDEIDNAAMYDRLLVTTQRSDILDILRNLQAASQERHLPAFRRCTLRGDGNRGRGPGRGRRRGHARS